MDSLTKNNLTKLSFKVLKYLIILCLIIIIYSTITTKNDKIKIILYLEIFICTISSIIYTILNNKINETENNNFNEFSKKRYYGWVFTTPAMLIVLCLVLANNININIDCLTIGIIILLDMIMLYFGYEGENNNIGRVDACILGFIPFIIMFLIIFIKYVIPKYNAFNIFLFLAYLLLWTGYGLAFILDENYKNIIMNVLDLTAKGFIGVIICYYYS